MTAVEGIKLRSTGDQKGHRVSNYATDYIYRGRCHSLNRRISVSGSSSEFLLFDMSNCLDRNVTVYTPIFDATGGPVNIDYYINSDYSGGTSLPSNNRYAGQRDAKSIITYGATGSNKGTKFSEGMIISGHKTSGSTQEGLEFVPVQNGNLLVELVNTDSSAIVVLVSFVWFEV